MKNLRWRICSWLWWKFNNLCVRWFSWLITNIFLYVVLANMGWSLSAWGWYSSFSHVFIFHILLQIVQRHTYRWFGNIMHFFLIVYLLVHKICCPRNCTFRLSIFLVLINIKTFIDGFCCVFIKTCYIQRYVSIYEWKIFEWDVNTTNKQTRTNRGLRHINTDVRDDHSVYY